MDIFISKPTWMEKKFNKGFESFNEFLDSNNIRPRTLGITDYPNESPLNEVIRLMKQCNGLIVLGYPQIFIEKGKIKEKNINEEYNLGTEWNHIETALAYSLNLPILILHHINVKRGIFEIGSLNSFIYETDLTKDAWILEKPIHGAFKTWKEKCLSYKPTKETGESNNEFTSFKGVLFKRKKSGEFDNTVYCPDCKIPMMSMEKIFPYQCSKCNFYSGFKSGEIDSVLSELEIEMGDEK